MNIIVIYKSKTGFTKQYAEWIADELQAELSNYHEAKKKQLDRYDIIIYGGSLHAVGITGVKFIMQSLNKLKDKKIIIFAVGASPLRKEVKEEVINNNFSKEEQKCIKFFYLRGGFNYNKLPLWDKFLMKLLQVKLKRKKILTSDEKGMLNAYKKPVDFTSRKNIKEIVSYIKSLST